MPTPSEIRRENLHALRDTQRILSSPAWVLTLEEQSPEVRREAALLALDVQSAKLRLENAELAELRDALAANDPDLAMGRTAMRTALKRLQQVRGVLDSVREFLGSLERVLR